MNLDKAAEQILNLSGGRYRNTWHSVEDAKRQHKELVDILEAVYQQGRDDMADEYKLHTMSDDYESPYCECCESCGCPGCCYHYCDCCEWSFMKHLAEPEEIRKVDCKEETPR